MSDFRCDYATLRPFPLPNNGSRLRKTQSLTQGGFGVNQRPTTYYNTCYSSKNRPKDGLLPSPRPDFNRMYSTATVDRSRSPSPAPAIHFTPLPHPHDLSLPVKRDATSSTPCGTATASSVPSKGYPSQLMFAPNLNYPLVCSLVQTAHPLSLTTPCPSELPSHPLTDLSARLSYSDQLMSQKRLSKSLMPEFRDGSHSPDLNPPDVKRGYRACAGDSDYESCTSSNRGLHSPMEIASGSDRSSGCSSPSVESDSDSALNAPTRAQLDSNRSLSYKTDSEHFFTSSSSLSSSSSSSPEPSEYPREDILFIDNSKLPNTPHRSSPVSATCSSNAYQLPPSLKRHSSPAPSHPALHFNKPAYSAQDARHGYSQPHHWDRHHNGAQKRRQPVANPRDSLHSRVFNYGYYADASLLALTAEMWTNSLDCKQTDAVSLAKLKYCQRLTACIEELYEGVQFCMVGSSMNGFSTSDCDLDLCMMIPNHPTPTRQDAIERLCEASYKLREKKIGQRHQVISAKTPIIKLSDPQSGFEVDISVNNQHGIRNTHLLHTYSELDPRVRPLVVFIKQWAKKQDICNARIGTLSSYSLTLMIIFYLQSGCSPAVLPSLQELSPEFFNSWEMFPPEQLERTQINWASGNRQNLAELLLGFFKFYSEFNYQNVMSIRTASVIAPSYDQLGFIRIEEPYTRENVAHSVSRPWCFTAIKSHIQNAYVALYSSDISTMEALYNSRPVATIPSSFSQNYYS